MVLLLSYSVLVFLGNFFSSLIAVNAQSCDCNCDSLNFFDQKILLDLKSSIREDPQQVFVDWSTSAVPCDGGWEGVSCDLNGRVTCLDLPEKSLKGFIPSSLGGLTYLQYLNLDSNNLYGSIPSSFSGLKNLQYLYLGSNSLSGTIPSLVALTKLEELYLSSNSLSGSIPSSLGGLKKLTDLGLDSNSLSGSIPSSFGGLTELLNLYLSSNSLSGSIPSSLGGLVKLNELFLNFNSLSGSIPSSLGGLKKLQELYLDSNSLSGSIPSSLGGLIELKELGLDSNSLSGSIPSSFGGLTNLQYLFLSSNSLFGPIPSSLGGLKKLKELGLNSNSLSGPIPSSFGGLTNLQNLYLSSNSLSGSIPLLAGLINLEELYLDSNSLSGSISTSLGQLANLKRLDLNSNFLSDSIPSSLGGLKKLVSLNFSANSLSGPIPSSLGGLINLEELDLNSNSLSGSIPSSLGGLVQLKYLDLNSNSLSGSIPSSLGGLVNLNELYLNFNSLSGSIPSSLGGLKKVKELYLDSNSLSGYIPSSLGGLTDLKELGLDSNSLSGSIPSSFGGLKNLHYLFLDSNSLSGSIPSSIGGLTKLEELYLNSNFLSGSIPSSLAGLKNLLMLSLSYNRLSGPILSLGGLNKLQTVYLDNNYLSGSLPFGCSRFNISDYSSNCLSYQPCNPGAQRTSRECSVFYGPPLSSPPPPKSPSPPPAPLSTGLSNYISNSSRKMSSIFRHASASVIVRPKLNWISEFQTLWPVRDQGVCGSCWAVVTVSAVEAAFAITTPLPFPPSLSVQQVIDCQPAGNCSGGWPLDALEYISNVGLTSESNYPYTGGSLQNCRANVPKSVRISHYEQVKQMGWLGALIAVQQQPLVVFVEASSSVFVNYKQGILSSEGCFENGVDHSVLLVGYKVDTRTPYWIIRNSWGTSWGESGYMKLAIQGGPGVCGINTFPGYYPVVKKSQDLCNSNNFGGKFLGKGSAGEAGTVNPCGRFPCAVRAGSIKCSCSDPFVAAINIDGSETCVPKNACDFFVTNPCGVGDCVNGALGSYSCVCPVGYAIGQFAADNSTTCIPATLISGPRYFTVPPSTSISCPLISQNYGISTAKLVAQNKGLKCDKPIPPGTVLNVTNSYQGCALPYATNNGDTCLSIMKLFTLALLSGPGSPNPYLDCTNLIPGQLVCIKAGRLSSLPLCTKYYSDLNDSRKEPVTCASIIKSIFIGNASLFFSLNPGIYCDRFLNEGIPLDQVCLSATSAIGSASACKGKFIKAKSGQNCQVILKKYFNGKQFLFKNANKVRCANGNIRVGSVICLPS